ncbi:L-rhamnose operon transcriptional activator rhaR [Cedecea neteri]|nr:L-rhamnose operon transcriptional activator rhaR [Cedecea neteri]
MSVFKAGERNYAALGEGKEFEYMGGHVLLDPNRGQMLAQVLPQWIHIPAASPQATSFRWLLDRLIAERETAQPGTQLASAQLSQLLFIQILRAHLQTSHSLPAGLLRALGDARLAPALQRIHANPARHWHLEELAKACAMSRTTFAQYFRNVSGITPGAYLTQWRMRLAEKALREQAVQIAMVAQSLGYTSESAFSNAFKRETGLSPKAWRNAARSPAS